FLYNADADTGYVGLDDTGQLNTATLAQGAGNKWFQDHVEIGFTQYPGGPRYHDVFQLPYFETAAQPRWPLRQMIGPFVGAFQLGRDLGNDAGPLPAAARGPWKSGSYGGNLEVVPPTTDFPLGRLVVGDTMTDKLYKFLQSQEVQTPFTVPTKWLDIGHVDEVIGFTGARVDG